MNNDHSVDFDDNHTVSVEQAVMLMLGFSGSFYHDVEGVLYEYSLREYVQDKEDWPDIAYRKALLDLHDFKEKIEAGAPEDEQKRKKKNDVVDEKKALLDKAPKVAPLAQEYFYLIADEVVKVKSGQDSLIRLDPDETKKRGCTQITKKSFFDWWGQKPQIKSEQENGPTRTEIRETRSGSTAQKNNEITTFLLAKALAELVDKARGSGSIPSKPDRNYKPKNLVKKDGTLNIAAIAHYLKEYTNGIDGQGDRSIKDRLKDAKNNTSKEDIGSIGVDEIEISITNAHDQ